MAASRRGVLPTLYDASRKGSLRHRAAGPTVSQRSQGSGKDATEAIDPMHWLLVGPGVWGRGVFSWGKRVPVFSYREEAESFLASRVSGDGWRVRGFAPRDLVLILRGVEPCVSSRGYEQVALDPPPEFACRVVDGLVTVDREDFVGSIVSRMGQTRPRCLEGGAGR